MKPIWILAFALLLPVRLAAEDACIKGHKCVPLDQFKCEDMTRSGFLERLCCAEAQRYLLVKTQAGYYGGYFHYCEIGPELAAELFARPSLGHYYNFTSSYFTSSKRAKLGPEFDCRNHPIPEF